MEKIMHWTGNFGRTYRPGAMPAKTTRAERNDRETPNDGGNK
jgi:hypothetical protein